MTADSSARSILPLGLRIAWRQLTSEKKRFVVAIVGVSFAVTLMLFQLGMYNAFLDKTVHPHRAMRGELVMTSKNYEYLYVAKPFTKRRLLQALLAEGVESVAPLLVDYGQWKNPETLQDKLGYFFGIDPLSPPFDLAGLETYRDVLKQSDAVLYDLSSDRTYGPVPEIFKERGEVETELGYRSIRVKGLYNLGPTLQAPATAIVSEQTFYSIFRSRPENMVNFGVIKLKAGQDPEVVAKRLAAILPEDVRVAKVAELIEQEHTYWLTRTPMGFIIISAMLLALFVGSVVVYQILYTDVSDHLQEYATLKAMGFMDQFMMKIVISEALIILVIGFQPGIIATEILYYLARTKAYMPAYLTLGRTLFVFVMTFGMCFTAGLMATRKLRSADPADIF